MKGSTARKILKIYQVVGWCLLTILLGGGLLKFIVAMFIQNWTGTLAVVSGIAALIGILWLYIWADVDKDNEN